MATPAPANLLVEGLGEGGGGSDVGIAGSLVGAGGLLQSLSISEVSSAVGLVGGGVVGLEIDIEESGEHLVVVLRACWCQQRNAYFNAVRALCAAGTRRRSKRGAASQPFTRLAEGSHSTRPFTTTCLLRPI